MRVDILERLADLIRPAIAYRPGTTPGDPPVGAADGDGFVVTVAMTSLAGCSGESFAAILRALGYQSEQRQGPAITVPLLPKAATEPVTPLAPTEPAETSEDIVAEAAESAVATEAAGEPVDAIAASADQGGDAVEAPAPEEVVAAPEPVMDVVAAEPVAEAVDEVVAESVAVEGAPAVASEGAPAEADAEAAPGEPVLVEPLLIEIWRPARHRQARRPARPQRHAARGHHRPAQAPAAAAGVEANAPPTAPEMPAPEHRRPPRRHRPNVEGATAGGAHRPDDRREKKRDFSPKEAHRGPRNGETRAKGQWSSAERPRERQPDPNSPFAKLAILKQRMEEGKT